MQRLQICRPINLPILIWAMPNTSIHGGP
uniref:Uncharacterized protein n=1 Tax=Rhizophora mucronata TaxID=61149 RepID=A0A2P2NLI9_RHIMU